MCWKAAGLLPSADLWAREAVADGARGQATLTVWVPSPPSRRSPEDISPPKQEPGPLRVGGSLNVKAVPL